jgi:hypothetical protein
MSHALGPYRRFNGWAYNLVFSRLECLQSKTEQSSLHFSADTEHRRERFQPEADRANEVRIITPQSTVHAEQSPAFGADTPKDLPHYSSLCERPVGSPSASGDLFLEPRLKYVRSWIRRRPALAPAT